MKTETVCRLAPIPKMDQYPSHGSALSHPWGHSGIHRLNLLEQSLILLMRGFCASPQRCL